MEGVGLGPALALRFALLGCAIVREQLERRAPLLALHLPVQHHTRGHHYQVGAPYAPSRSMTIPLQPFLAEGFACSFLVQGTVGQREDNHAMCLHSGVGKLRGGFLV